MLKNTKAVEAVKNTAQGLGALIWWTLSGRATPDQIRTVIQEEGGDPSIVPEIDGAAAVRREAREWTSGARGTGADRYRAEVVRDDADCVTVGILKRVRVSGHEVKWEQVDAVTYDGATKTWNAPCTTPEATSFVASAKEAQALLDHAWIRPHLVQARLAAAAGIALRDRGGVWYVPTQHRDEVDRLARIVGRIGASRLDVIDVSASDASRASVARGVEATARETLDGLLERIRGWSESARKIPDTHSGPVLNELANLSASADLYADALSMGLDDLRAAIVEARAEASRILALPRSEPAAASHRTVAAEVKEGVAADPKLVELLRVGASRVAADPSGRMWIPIELAREIGIPVPAAGEGVKERDKSYRQWRFGVPAASAIALGYIAGLTSIGPIASGLKLTPIPAPVENGAENGAENGEAAAQAPAPVEPAADPEPAVDESTTVLDQDGDVSDEADLRERLAEKSPAELREIYTRATGQDPGKRSKEQMIKAISRVAA